MDLELLKEGFNKFIDEGMLDQDNKRLIRATIQRGDTDPNFKNDILYKKALFLGTQHQEVRFADWLNKYEAGVYNQQEEPEMAEASPRRANPSPLAPKSKSPGFNAGVKSILEPDDIESVNRILNNQEELGDNQELWEKLFAYYSQDMPYGTQKARTEDPAAYIQDKLEQEFLGRIF